MLKKVWVAILPFPHSRDYTSVNPDDESVVKDELILRRAPVGPDGLVYTVPIL